MLVIRAIQVQNTDGICTYDVTVFINAQPIWKGLVGNHKRSDGWAVLAGHIAHAAGLQPEEKQRSIELSLKIEAGSEEPIRCPGCDRILGLA